MTPAAIRDARVMLGMTQAAFAALICAPDNFTVSRYERGHRKLPASKARLINIALANAGTRTKGTDK